MRMIVLAGAALGLLALVMPAAAMGPGGPQSVAALASRLSPAVVNISSSHRVANASAVPFPKAADGSALGEHFDDLNPNEGQGEDAMAEAESLGSGFIISADGLIVTNDHVIEGADEVSIYLTDGTRLPAKIIGEDAKTDLAVLKITAKHPLPFVEFGNSDKAEVGDWVMAIGNPFGLGGTVTLGIVSARNRDIQSGPYDSYIQTDASINQGNSGGPLFDMDGKVVGIATAIIARGGSSLGIGFAVPGNLAKPVVEQLARFGETRRGWIGVGIQEVTEDIAASLGRADARGAMVTDTTSGGPADKVLAEGDIILSFDGKPITKMRDLPRVVAEAGAGRIVPIKVFRDGKEQVLSITVGRLQDSPQAGPDPAKDESAMPGVPKQEADGPAPTLGELLGFDLAPVDAVRRKTFGLPETLAGLVVTEVTPGTDAYAKGVLAGWVVNEINQKRVASLNDVQRIVDSAREAGRPAVLLKVTDAAGNGRFIAVRLTG